MKTGLDDGPPLPSPTVRAKLAAKIAEQDATRGRPRADRERIDNLRLALFSEEITNAVINAIGGTEGEPIGLRAATVLAAIRDRL